MSTMATPDRFSCARQMGLTVPIVCAPMGGAAGGQLAGAVTRAGALGMIGMGSSGNAAMLRRELGWQPARPFGIGLVDWVAQREPALIEVALDARPSLISVSFGAWDTNWDWWLARAQESGAATAVQVASVDQARRAEDAGVDLIVARGKEAGGHGEPRHALMPLLERVVSAVSQPVLAAGGITTGPDLIRVLQAGASGAWVGTAFAAASESQVHPDAQARLVTAKAADTVITRVTDAALGYPWPAHLPERAIATPFERTWRGREHELVEDEAAVAKFAEAAKRNDFDIVPVNAGTGVERINRITGAQDIVRGFAAVLEAAGWSA